MNETCLSVRQLSRRWNVKTTTLQYWRHRGTGPSYLKLEGMIRYRLSDVLAYEKKHMKRSVQGLQQEVAA